MAGMTQVPVTRFTTEVYDDLEKKVLSQLPVVPKTDIEAGMKLGIEHVLRAIRTGYVSGTR